MYKYTAKHILPALAIFALAVEGADTIFAQHVCRGLFKGNPSPDGKFELKARFDLHFDTKIAVFKHRLIEAVKLCPAADGRDFWVRDFDVIPENYTCEFEFEPTGSRE